MTDWYNIDLESPRERDLDLLDSYNFETLLLEVACNIPDNKITRETVKKQAMESIRQKYETAIEILNANLDNLTTYAKKES